MYDRSDIVGLIKLVETGVLKIGQSDGVKIVGKYGLEDWKTAFDVAADNAGMGDVTLIAP